MRFGRLVLSIAICVIVASSAWAADKAPALSGKVTGPDGKPMEGVVVTAGRPSSTISISVVSDADGNYRFPANKLASGPYFLDIRATGYDLDGTGAATVATGHTATADLKLKATHDLASQMTNADWLASWPGTDAQKSAVLGCTGCHTVQRIARATHDETEWVATIKRMASYAQESSPLKPQKTEDSFLGRTPPEVLQHLAAYLASVDLSAGPWKYPLKTMPRVTGRGTQVVVTEYKLPDPIFEPHDVILDGKGKVWFSDFVELKLGNLDPKTGKVTEYALPQRKQNAPVGELDIEPAGPHDLMLGMTWQATLARFDTDTKKFNFYPIPAAANDKNAQLIMTTDRADVDGKVWTDNGGAPHEFYRVDLKSGAMQKFGPFPHTSYGLAADSHDNLFFLDFGNDTIGRVDAKTGEATFYQTPTKVSRPRRGHIDAQDRFWFAEFNANSVGMLDPKTGAIKEWQVPTPWTAPYDAILDKDGQVWTGGMTTDRVVRLDPQTGQSVEYPLPDDTNIRRVFVDNRTSPPTFWTGSNHGAAIVKVEPLN